MTDETHPPHRAAQTEKRKRYTSEELLENRKEIEIAHRGEVYRLRLTSTGKLQLVK